MHKAFIRVFISDIAIFLIRICNVRKRGVKQHPQSVFSLSPQSGYIILPDSVHIVWVSQKRAVPEHRCHGIKTIKMQHDLFFSCPVSIHTDTALILIFLLHSAADSILVVLPVWVFHVSISQQICIHAARHLRLLPVFL